MTPVLDPKQVAATNRAVDVSKLEQVHSVIQVLKRAGVAKTADYRLSPPLGSGPAKSAPSGTFAVRLHSGG